MKMLVANLTRSIFPFDRHIIYRTQVKGAAAAGLFNCCEFRVDREDDAEREIYYVQKLYV